jgi:hypothetical protein
MLKYYPIELLGINSGFIAATTARKANNAFKHYQKSVNQPVKLGKPYREYELSKADRLLIAITGTIAGGNHTFPSDLKYRDYGRFPKNMEKPVQSPSLAIIDSRVPDKTVAKAHKIAASVGATVRFLEYGKDNGCRILRAFYLRGGQIVEGLSVNAHSLTEHKKYLESAFGSIA